MTKLFATAGFGAALFFAGMTGAAAYDQTERPTYDYAYEGELTSEEIYKAKEEVAFMQAVVAASLAQERGDQTGAYEAFKPLAEEGHPGAQYSLGFMWEHGKGVEKDITKAIDWYQKSADQNHSTAQLRLGLMYRNGIGTPRDFPQAYMWLSLASRDGMTEAIEARRSLREDMTEEQLATSERMIRSWLASRKALNGE